MQLLKKLTTPPLLLWPLAILASGILWFLPDICGRASEAPIVITALNTFALVSISAIAAHALQYVVALSISLSTMYLCAKRHIMRSATTFLLPLMLFTALPRLQLFTSGAIAFVLCFVAFAELLSMYRRQVSCCSEAFNLGFLGICAALFEPSYIWMLLVLLLGIAVIGALDARTASAFVAGIAIPIILLTGSFALVDALPLLNTALHNCCATGLSLPYATQLSELFLGGIISTILIIAIADYLSSNATYNLNVRLSHSFMTLAFALTLLLAFFGAAFDHILMLPVFYASLLLGFYFGSNNGKMANILFIVLAVCAAACNVCTLMGW